MRNQHEASYNVFSDEVLPHLIERQENLANNNINSIPFNFGSLKKHIFGIYQGNQYGITGPSGSSKSKFTRDLFLFQPYNFYMRNKENMDIDIRVNMFCLEDSKQKVVYNLLSKALWDFYKIRITAKELAGAENNILSADIRQKIDSLHPYFESLFKKVYLSNTSNPTGIRKEIEKFLFDESVGYYVDPVTNKKLDNTRFQYEIENVNSDGLVTKKKATELHKHIEDGGQILYKKINPNLFVINIIDNLQVLTNEGGQSKYNTLDAFTRKLMRNRLCESFGCTNVLVQQQSQQMRQIKTDSSGEVVSDTLVPSIAGLGEFKNSVQTMHYLLGIYSPFNDNIKTFRNYNIEKLGYFYRHVFLMKSNFAPNFSFPMFADPIAETFVDMPDYKDSLGMKAIYDEISRLEN